MSLTSLKPDGKNPPALSPAETRRARQREDARRAILDATEALLLEAGSDGFSMRRLAERCGYTTPTIYHYFDSKEAYGLDLIERYGVFFARKLDRHLCNPALSPLSRLRAFVVDATDGMARHGFRRGCLIGNLGQEMGALPESFRARLKETFEDWQARFSACLVEAQQAGELAPDADTAQLAAFFWIGWEGAVLRAKLERSAQPLETFAGLFFASLPVR